MGTVSVSKKAAVLQLIACGYNVMEGAETKITAPTHQRYNNDMIKRSHVSGGMDEQDQSMFCKEKKFEWPQFRTTS